MEYGLAINNKGSDYGIFKRGGGFAFGMGMNQSLKSLLKCDFDWAYSPVTDYHKDRQPFVIAPEVMVTWKE